MLLNSYSLTPHLTLKNRIVMAPMTRCKSDDDLVPTKDMQDYYARRADAGLIVTEGTIIRPDGLGYRNVPGIFTPKQIAGWRKITDAVHENGGHIFSQIWHVGRVSHPEFLNGQLPLAPSVTEMTGPVSRSNGLTYGKSRALSLIEIKQLIKDFAAAANNAMQAGFDGIEIHGANGYLIDQFLHHHTNLRQDEYGMTIENMARFALEVIDACGDSIGYDRVGLRLSPGAYLHQITGVNEDASVFQYLLSQLNQKSLAYIHTGSYEAHRTFPELAGMTMTQFLRQYYHGKIISCGSHTLESAEQGINQGEFDLVAMGRPFIANHDLINRVQNKLALAAYDAAMLKTLY